MDSVESAGRRLLRCCPPEVEHLKGIRPITVREKCLFVLLIIFTAATCTSEVSLTINISNMIIVNFRINGVIRVIGSNVKNKEHQI